MLDYFFNILNSSHNQNRVISFLAEQTEMAANEAAVLNAKLYLVP